ncbi:MAG: malate synthase G, partial [Porticoccaceae bacterium]|nr:malate synthase G [Porticoccaceae bacterium]
MSQSAQEFGLKVAKPIHDLVNQSILPGTGIKPDHFWPGFAAIVAKFAPINAHLLSVRDDLQSQIDNWHIDHSESFEFSEYKAFLQD